MSRKKGNFEHNYPLVIKYLKQNDIEYVEYSGGQHLKILGPRNLIELWPSRMTYYIIESEDFIDLRYKRLGINFNEEELGSIL